MLGAYVIDFNGNWGDLLPLIELTYTIFTTLASKWLLMNIFKGEDAYLLLDCLKFVK